jgi:hypothetical protein
LVSNSGTIVKCQDVLWKKRVAARAFENVFERC